MTVAKVTAAEPPKPSSSNWTRVSSATFVEQDVAIGESIDRADRECVEQVGQLDLIDPLWKPLIVSLPSVARSLGSSIQ